tara:strand:+ start:5721 stop:6341 length:621 start_codon:yes stop_codon:yes gene_type:complete
MFTFLAQQNEKNKNLKILVSNYIQKFYSTKSDLGKGDSSWKEIMNLLTDQEKSYQDRQEDVLKKYTQDLQKGPTVMTAGKFLIFNYTTQRGDSGSYFVMVVGAFGGNGVYSNKNTHNELLTCFVVDSNTNLSTLAVLGNVISDYVDPRIKSYNFLSNMKNSRSLFKKSKKRGISREGLNTLFPKSNFRTFKLNICMKTVYEVDVNG